MENLIINGTFAEVTDIQDNYIKTTEGEYVIFDDVEKAGEEAENYWRDMADNDQSEFLCMVGEKALIEWGLGNSYAVGNIAVSSLNEWFELTSEYPEEHHASYDGEEIEIGNMNRNLQRELGVSMPCVAYRIN